MRSLFLIIFSALIAGLVSAPATAQPVLVADSPGKAVYDISFGVFGQDTNSGIIAAWIDTATSDATISFYRYELSSTWESEQIAAISDVGTSPTNSTALPIRLLAGDYSGDGLTDLTVMYNSFLTTTSLMHYQRTSSGFVAGDTSMANVIAEADTSYSSRFWQDIAMGNPIGDGETTLVSYSIDLYRTATGSAAPVPRLGFGAQDLYFHRRTNAIDPFGAGSYTADKEIARTTSEEGTIALADVTGDGGVELIWSENLWNRSPGWGHQFTLYAASNDGGAGAGVFTPGDTTTFYDEQPTQMYPNGMPKVGLIRNEGLYTDSYGQFGMTAMVAGQDLTRDGIPDIVLARADTFIGDDYGDTQTGGATNDTDGMGVLQILQTPTTGAFNQFSTFGFDTEDFGTWEWTKLAASDVNGDTHSDLVAAARNTATGEWHLFLYQWNLGGFISGNGAATNSWPSNNTFAPPSSSALLNSASRSDLIIPFSGASITALAIGNADSDPNLEIVYGLSTGEIYVLDLAGTLTEVPVELSEFKMD